MFKLSLQILHGRSQDFTVGGGEDNFFSDFCSARGIREHAPRKNILKLSNLVRFGVYLNKIFSFKKLKIYHFLYKI